MRIPPRPNPTAQSFISKAQIFSSVSKPNPISNIRTVRYHVDPRQSLQRCRLEARRLRATAEWNRFWTKHNIDYNTKLEALKAEHPNSGEVPSDQMSKFYATHLADTRANHKAFNAWWIRENFYLLFAAARCWLWEKLPNTKEPGFFGGH